MLLFLYSSKKLYISSANPLFNCCNDKKFWIIFISTIFFLFGTTISIYIYSADSFSILFNKVIRLVLSSLIYNCLWIIVLIILWKLSGIKK